MGSRDVLGPVPLRELEPSHEFGGLGPFKTKGPERWAGPHRRQIDQKTAEKPPHESLEKKQRLPRLRANHHLMEPDELRPEERWDRIVGLLALMTMPEAPDVLDSEAKVLMS